MNPKKIPSKRKPNAATHHILVAKTAKKPTARSGPAADARSHNNPATKTGKLPRGLRPLLTMRAIPNPPSHNYYGFERIHFVQFNFDGEGDALVRYNGKKDLHFFHRNDLKMVLLGDPISGDRWYRPE